MLSKLALDKLEIIEDARIDTNTNRKKKDAWSSIHQLFNQVSAHSRTLDQIQNQWRKTKSFAKTNNSAFIRQTKQTGGGPAPKPLSSVEEELVARLPKHFEIDFNVYDSNSQVNETQDFDLSIQDVLIKKNDEMCDTDGDTPIKEKKLPLTFKRKRRSMNCENEFESENFKRIKLLDLSIKQKELEMKYSEENHIVETRRNELIEKQMKEEHALKVEKIKLEIESLKRNEEVDFAM